MEMTRVTNTRPTLLHGPDSAVFGNASDGAPRTVGAAGLTFQPGGNNVDSKLWQVAKKNATVQSWLKLGWLSEGGDTSAPEGVPPPETLADYGEPAAVALVEMEGDVKALQRWEQQEDRAAVRAAVKRKLASITGTGNLHDNGNEGERARGERQVVREGRKT